MSAATYIEVSAEVRYWEDAKVNDAIDTDGTLIPARKGLNWAPVIRLSDGQIMDWPQGITASVHYKVCDQGEYWLLDENRERFAKWAGNYVPDAFLCHGDTGYGDYIIFNIGADGKIENYCAPTVRMVCSCNYASFCKCFKRDWRMANFDAVR